MSNFDLKIQIKKKILFILKKKRQKKKKFWKFGLFFNFSGLGLLKMSNSDLKIKITIKMG